MIVEYNLKYNFGTDTIFRSVRRVFIDWVLNKADISVNDLFLNKDWSIPSEWTTYDGQIFLSDFKVDGTSEHATIETYGNFLRVITSINDASLKELLEDRVKFFTEG